MSNNFAQNYKIMSVNHHLCLLSLNSYAENYQRSHFIAPSLPFDAYNFSSIPNPHHSTPTNTLHWNLILLSVSIISLKTNKTRRYPWRIQQLVSTHSFHHVPCSGVGRVSNMKLRVAKVLTKFSFGGREVLPEQNRLFWQKIFTA